VSNRFEKTFGATVDHPWGVGLFLVVMSVTALFGYIAPERVTSLFTAPAEEEQRPAGERARRGPDVDPFSVADADVIIVVDAPDLFSPSGANAVREVVASLESLDYVDSVLWMDRVPPLNIFGLREPVFPPAHASPRQFATARERALANPLVGGQLLSDDAKTLLLLVRIDWLAVRNDEDCTEGLRRAAREAAARFPDAKLSFQLTGRVPMFLTWETSQRENRRKYQIIGYGLTVVMAMVLFRGIHAVLIVCTAPCLGVFWTLGLLRYFDVQDNPFIDIVLPIMVSLIGLTDGVHLMVEIRRRRAAGLPERAAARAGVTHVGLASFLTALTTGVGFGTLALAHHKLVVEFGLSCVLGVALSFLAVITVIPLACSSRLGRRVHEGHNRGLVDRNLNRVGGIIDFSLRWPRAISWGGIALTVALLAVSFQLRPDERRTTSLPSDSEAIVALEHMDRVFGGLELGSVDIRWDESVPDDSPEVLEVIGEVDRLLAAEPLLGHPLSIRNLLDALPGEGPVAERMSMIELLPPPLKRAFYNPEQRLATINYRVQDLGIARYSPVFERVAAGLNEASRRHPGFEVALSGPAVDRWESLYQIVIDLASSLGSDAIIIFFVLSLAYRSLRLGLIAMVPNLFPLAITGTYLVVTGQALEIVTVCAFTISLGIAVDDTIHFLTRYTEEREHWPDREAIRRAFTAAGTGMIMSNVVLVVGFSTVIFSELREQRIFGMMSVLTLGTALIGDLLFLPAMLLNFRGRGKPPTPRSAQPALPSSVDSAETLAAAGPVSVGDRLHGHSAS
jgi:predicted RND superfamily exporter protein